MRKEILDHGYVELVESWGSDERIIEAARMSTNKGFLGWERDKGLLAYLYKNKHFTPFEMAGAIFEIKAPIFVFREWHRHRTQSYNEMSARYIPIPNQNYVPSIERLMLSGGANKQASSAGSRLELAGASGYTELLKDFYATAEQIYQVGLDLGVPKELARIVLPVGRYSRMRASANLRNWLQFLELRIAPNAQWEIQEYARGVEEMLSEIFPRTMELFNAGRS